MNKVEMLDLVDEDDNVLGTYSREEIYKQGLRYTRFVDAFIRGVDGKLWVPIRNADKQIAPNGFDIGVGGHIEHGESEEHALRKELSEEIGWNLDDCEWRFIGKFGPKDGLQTISYVYEVVTESEPPLNPGDFVSSEWMTPKELYDSIKAGHPAKSNILPLLKIVYQTPD